MSKCELRIDILGTSVTISADEEPEYLGKILDKYSRAVANLQSRTGLKDPLKTAILTGFMLCEDLEKTQKSAAANKEPPEAEQLTLGMISRLDEVISDSEKEAAATARAAAENSISKLQGTIKNYDWGSTEWIPALLSRKNLSRIPWAELWLELDPSAPEYRKLPFLFKLLAAEKPLSIQVHPKAELAREGFTRENYLKIPPDAPNRNYRDANHKNEIICALSPFAALCGFREAGEISALVEIISGRSDESLKSSMDRLLFALKEENPLKAFLSELLVIDNKAIKALALSMKLQLNLLKNDFPKYKNLWELCIYLSVYYPGDPGTLAPLFLNIIELEPGEAAYIPAGTFHSYIRGMGIELMNCSDNVLRGGLTTKHIDTTEVFKALDFCEFKPEILQAPDPGLSWYSYPLPVSDFSLSVMNGTGGIAPFPGKGPSVLLMTEGSATVNENEMVLLKGESVFIPAGRKPVLSGTFTAFVAS